MSTYRRLVVSNLERCNIRSKLERAREFLEDDSGTEMMEWVLVTAVLVVFTVGALITIMGDLKLIFEAMLRQLAR